MQGGRGAGDLADALRRWLKANKQKRGVSSDQLAKALAPRLGRAVSAHMVETWIGETKRDWHIPADAMPALAEILQDNGGLRQLLNEEQRRHLELGESAARLFALLESALADARKLAGNAPRGKRRAKRRK